PVDLPVPPLEGGRVADQIPRLIGRPLGRIAPLPMIETVPVDLLGPLECRTLILAPRPFSRLRPLISPITPRFEQPSRSPLLPHQEPGVPSPPVVVELVGVTLGFNHRVPAQPLEQQIDGQMTAAANPNRFERKIPQQGVHLRVGPMERFKGSPPLGTPPGSVGAPWD